MLRGKRLAAHLLWRNDGKDHLRVHERLQQQLGHHALQFHRCECNEVHEKLQMDIKATFIGMPWYQASPCRTQAPSRTSGSAGLPTQAST